MPHWLAGDLSSLALEQGDAEVRAAVSHYQLSKAVMEGQAHGQVT